MASDREAWLSLLPKDPRPGLLASHEPFTRFVAMTAILGTSEDDADVRRVRNEVIADPGVRALNHPEILLSRVRGVLVRAEEGAVTLGHSEDLRAIAGLRGSCRDAGRQLMTSDGAPEIPMELSSAAHQSAA